MADANLLEIIVRARDQTKAAFASAKKGIAATKAATSSLTKNLGGLNKTFSGASSKISGFGTKLKGLMTSAIGPLIGVMGIAAVTMALKKAVDAFGSFEQAAANASSVTGKTGAAFVETKNHIMAVSKVLGETTVFKASEAADAFYDLASAGYDVANITKTELKPILDLAAASQTDLKATTELVTSTLGQFGMAIQDSKKVADVFARTIGSSKATMEKLGNSMVYVGPVAHALGRTLEETSATLGVLYNKGFDASMAGTALRGALSRLMNPTAQVEAKLSELGVTVAEVNPKTRSMADILDTLTDAGMDTADAMELFGLRAGPAMLALTQNTDDIRSLTLELENAGGAAAIMAEQQLTTFEGKMKLVSSKLEATSLILGERFAPMILNAANAITDTIIPALGGFFDAISKKITPALGPLREKLDAAFEKMTGGVSLMQRLKDVGVILGSTLRVLADALGWVIEKLNPLWELTGKLQSGIGILADLLRTEEDYTNDLRAAVELLNTAKAELVVLNEKLIIRMFDLAKEIEKSNWGMEKLDQLEKNVIAAKAAHTAIQSELNAALSHGDIDTYNEKERELITATEILEKATAAYNHEVIAAAESQIDYGTATNGVIIAHGEVVKSLDEIEDGLETEIRLEEDAALATEKAAGAHLVLNDGITGVAKNLKDNLLFNLDLLIFRLGEFIDLIVSAGSKIEKGLTFAFPGYKALKESFENIIILEEKLVDKTATSMDAVATTVSVGMVAAGQSLELFNQYVRETMDTVTSVTEESNEIAVKSWEERIKEIKVQIDIEAKNYQFLTDVQKEEADKRIAIMNDDVKVLEDKVDAEARHLSSLTNTTKEVTKTMEEFSISVGKTTISFKGAAAEVLKNADAYEKLQKAAQTLIDMDWAVFTEFEASLPIIEAGLGDLESSFVGFKDVLDKNIDKLENVKQSVMDISEIATPFLEKGFLNGIKAIGDFAGTLKNAGSAINDFSSLQEVSIEGCINFSLHVRDMVSALAILEDQMEDLVPSFGEMNSLIIAISDAFLYGGDKMAGFTDDFDSAINASKGILDSGAENFTDFQEIVEKALDAGKLTYLADTYIRESDSFQKKWKTITVENAEDVRHAMHGWLGGFTSEFETTVGTITSGTEEISDTYRNATMHLHNWVLETYGMKISQEELYAVMESPPEEQKKWLDDIMHSEAALTFQMDKQTNALKAQTEQLSKITEALQPYLNFMRTLNELAALSTLSTEELNAGLNSINDTLVNLGSAMDTFDLRPVMESLFGMKIPEGEDLEGPFTGGKATGFIDVMEEYQSEFHALTVYGTRLTSSIIGLVAAFDTLADIGDSVLADQIKLKKVFEDIVLIMSNFSAEMGEAGFADAIAKGMEAMIKSADPLSKYFSKNNAAVIDFNNTLGTFKTTITHVVDVMDLLKEISEMTLPSVDELEAGFDKAAEAVARFDEALLKHLGISTEGHGKGMFEVIDEEAFSSNFITNIIQFADNWGLVEEALGDSLPVFNDASSSIGGLANSVSGLVGAFVSLAKMPVLTAGAFSAGMEDMTTNIENFAKALEDNIDAIEKALESVDDAWANHADNMEKLMPGFKDAAGAINTLAGGIISVARSFESLKEVEFEKEFATGFKNLTKATGAFATALANNIGGLTNSLDLLVSTWMENEAETVRLMRSFIIIADNFMIVIAYANRLQEAFGSMTTESGTLGKGFDELTEFMGDVTEGIKEIYTTEGAADLATFVKDVGLVVDALETLNRKIDIVMTNITKKTETAVNSMKTEISKLNNMVGVAFCWGVNIMDSFIAGIDSMQGLLRDELIDVSELISHYLGVGSNTKLGALSHLTDWPKNLVETFAEGIRKGTPELSKALSALTLPTENLHMPAGYAGLLGGGGNTVTMYNTWNVTNQEDADYAISEMENLLLRRRVL